MGHVHYDDNGVECPDCGQRFPPEESVPDDDHVFKKPTIISRVLTRILNPFSYTEAEPVPLSTNEELKRHRRQNSKHRDKRRFGNLDLGSQYGESNSGSSWGSPSARTTWKRSRTIESVASRSHYQRGSTKGKPYKAVRRPFDDLTFRTNYNDSPTSKRYRDFDFEDVDCDSTYQKPDRLNLDKYLQPQRNRQAVVQAWINDLLDCDPIDSLLTPDLSCECKSGANVEKEKSVNDFLAATRDSFQRMQKSLEDIKLFSDKGIYADRKAAVNANEQIKAVIADCANSQLRILDFLQKRS